jgi:Ribbon-helix-helix protein, copG family.
MPHISLRVDEETKKVIEGYAKMKGQKVSEVVVNAIKEKIEDQDDYKLALLAYDTIDMNDTTTLKDLCNDVGIDYEEL